MAETPHRGTLSRATGRAVRNPTAHYSPLAATRDSGWNLASGIGSKFRSDPWCIRLLTSPSSSRAAGNSNAAITVNVLVAVVVVRSPREQEIESKVARVAERFQRSDLVGLKTDRRVGVRVETKSRQTTSNAS